MTVARKYNIWKQLDNPKFYDSSNKDNKSAHIMTIQWSSVVALLLIFNTIKNSIMKNALIKWMQYNDKIIIC